MNLRFSTTILFATLAVMPVARADEPTPAAESVQVAQANAAPSLSAERSSPAPHAVHGTVRGVLAAAAKGPDALRRDVQRTRMIYGYRFEDYAPADWYR
jgi:hypothetical protein